jgi:hypothetical protein
MAAGLLRTMFVPSAGVLVPEWPLGTVAILIAAWWGMIGPNAFDVEVRDDWRRRTLLTIASAASLALILGSRSSPFLYFQF